MRKQFNIELPEDILTIKDLFVAEGFKLFVVGGAVRDALLGKKPKDFDLATDAHPDEVERMLTPIFKMLPIGEAFGIWQAMTPTGEFEIATFREDVGEGRRPDTVEFTTIEGDVKRRDLTINALFFDIDAGEIVDLVGGLEDLNSRTIRAVGKAADRFKEDKLRILRAIRFVCRFDSVLEWNIVQAIHADNTPISGDGIRLSNERIRDEFLKGLKTATSPIEFMRKLEVFGLTEWVFGDLKVIPCKLEIKDPIVLLAVILSENSIEDVKKVLNEQTFTNLEIKGITFLLKLADFTINSVVPTKKAQKNSGVSKDQMRTFAKDLNLDEDFLETFIQFELTVTGQFVMEEMGIEKGPKIGETMNDMEKTNFLKLLERKFTMP